MSAQNGYGFSPGATTGNKSDAVAGSRRGLTTDQARRLLQQFGPNAVREERRHLARELLEKFWAPVPWMLEATVVLELVLGKYAEAIVIGALLIFNAALSFAQEGRARGALELLRKRLTVMARVLRDGAWTLIAAEELVPGDYIHIRMGDLAPADLKLAEGSVSIDQSALTGESMPVEVARGGAAYAGSLVKRGEAGGEVTATGARTYFGKTAELVRSAKTVSHLQTIIFSIVKYLVALDVVFAAAVGVYAWRTAMPPAQTLPFVLILLVASVPAALPATFTLATALGALELAGRGVLVTRLSAIEEAAAMDVLCSDKTGTITRNQLTLAQLRPYPPFGERDLLRIAADASDEATQDPIDLAILAHAGADKIAPPDRRLSFIPFDPATRISEAAVVRDGEQTRALKGAPHAVASRCAAPPGFDADVERLAAGGYRVLAAACGAGGVSRVAGLLAIEDPPREDSAAVVASLRELGVRVIMVTGDGVATARAVAAQVGIEGRACSSADIANGGGDASGCGVFAGVFPEDKFRLVESLQRRGHIAGMTGDGVNDAPALKQAEVGIAVANATDVAKASASLVLTSPGLSGALAAVESSRRIYQRMLTYTLNKIIKTVQIALFLSIGVMLTRTFIVTPLLIVLLLFANDFVTMSIATDRVSSSPAPDRWHVSNLMRVGMILGALVLLLLFGLFFYARDFLGLPLTQLRTLSFVALVFTGQGMVYLVRERGHFWNSAPSKWMLISSIADIAVVSLMSIEGILMAPLPASIVGAVFLACVVYLVALDFVKAPMLRRLKYG